MRSASPRSAERRVGTVECLFEIAPHGQLDLDQGTEQLDELRVEIREQRVGDCDHDARSVPLRRQRAQAARVVLFEERNYFGVDFRATEIDDLETQLFGQHVGE